VILRFFRVTCILPGPWYLTWLTSFAGLALMFVYGMWIGLGGYATMRRVTV
jgi:hypothetical protein